MARVQVSVYRKSETTSNTVISNCEKRNFRRSSDLAEAKIYLFAVLQELSLICLPLTVSFGLFAHKSAWPWFWLVLLGCLFSNALSCCFFLKRLLFVQLPLSSLSCPGSSCLPLLLTSFLLSPSSQPPIGRVSPNRRPEARLEADSFEPAEWSEWRIPQAEGSWAGWRCSRRFDPRSRSFSF